MSDDYIMIDGDWKKDILYGTAIGLLFVFVNLLVPEFRIGVPQAILLGVIIAPLIEEFAFRSFILGFLTRNTGNFNVANIIQAILFALFHWRVYGMGLQAAFIGAGIFAIIVGYVARDRKSILPGIIVHGIFNMFIIYARMVFVST